MLATTVDDVRRAAREGKVALLMGVEGAHALGTRDPDVALERLRELHRRGVRYMTITWSNDNALGHSSTGGHPARGLTELGRRAVREMNALGMIVDVSHVSDRTFWDIMEITERPVMASHSSARALADHPRNMDDAMIRRVAEGGGAVCVNYFSQFIDVAYRDRRERLERRHRRRFESIAEEHPYYTDRGLAQLRLAMELDAQIAPPTLETLGAHFAHIVALGGPSAACLGSDFDGVPELPLGMEDVSDLGALEAELTRRELDVTAIFGENVLRVLAAQTPSERGD
jgi:membrane dipeptidase